MILLVASPSPLRSKPRLAVSIEAGALADAFEGHPLQLAFGARKSAGIISPRGLGARAARRELFGGKPELKVVREHGVTPLPLVDTYKHVGVAQAGEGAIRAEIQQRCSAAWVAFQEGRLRLFRCKRISPSRHGAMLNSQAPVWCWRLASSWRRGA